MGGSNVPPVLYWPYSTLFGSHDQYSTLGGSHMTNIEHLGCHMTNIEHFWNHMTKSAHFSSMSSHMTNTITVLRFIFIGTTPSAAFVNASGLAGDAKWLCLSVSDNLLITWFSIPSWIHPHKNYTAIKARRRLLYVNYWYSGCGLNWQYSTRLTPHAVLQSRPHPSYH